MPPDFLEYRPDVLPMTSRSHVIYQYKYRCEQRYIGKTIQVLSERIKQHVPSKLSANVVSTPLKIIASNSAITKHVKEYPARIPESPAARPEASHAARSKSHLDLLEAIFIRSLSPTVFVPAESAHKNITPELVISSCCHAQWHDKEPVCIIVTYLVGVKLLVSCESLVVWFC